MINEGDFTLKKNRIIIFAVIISMLFCNLAVYAEKENINNTTIQAWDDYYYAVKSDGALYKTKHYDTEKAYENGDSPDNFIAANDMVSERITDGAVSVAGNYALKEDNSVWEINDMNNTLTKVMDNVREISSSGGHTLFVKNDNTLWGLGNNYHGQLAQGEMNKSLEEQIAEGLRHMNKTSCTPEKFDEPVKIMDDVKSAVANGALTIVLKNDGTVWTFGYDYVGQLGIGVRYVVNNTPTWILSDIKRIFASGEACFALDYDNTLWRWGSNYTGYAGSKGILKPEKYIENALYVTNMPSYNLVVKTDGSLWLYGESEMDGGEISKKPLKIADNVVSVTGLYADTGEIDRAVVLKDNGSLMLLTLPWEHFDNLDEVLTLEKLMYNVRLPDEAPIVKSFSDISDKTEEIQKSIKSLTKADIISGTSETEFSPDKPITRAEIAALLLRMTAKNDEDGNGGFTDVTSDDWYYNTAGASKKYNIIAGFEDNTFRGDETISKVQLISLAARTLKNEGHVTEAIDVTDINAPEWAVNDLSLALQEGLISENDLKDMDDSMTRADAAVILYKLYEKI